MASDNSLRKQAEPTTHRALHANEARFRTLTTLVPVGIFHTDAQGLVTYVNEKWCEIGGMTAEEAMGTGWLTGVHPEDRARITTKWNAFAKNQTTYRTEYRYQRPDGVTAYCYVQALPEIDLDGKLTGYIGCVTDISERKRAEKALRESDDRFARAVAGTNDGIWDWNVRTGDNYFSPRWKAILGYGEDELEHHVDTFYDLVHPDDLALIYKANSAHFEEMKPNDVEIRMRHKDGHYVWIHERGKTIWGDDGKPLLMAGSITDITERKRLEEQLVHAQRMEAVGQLTGGIAHDFNNLMAIMMGNAELLVDSVGEDEEAKLYIEAIKTAVDQGASLTSRLLAFSRKQMLSPVTMDVTALVGSLHDMLHRSLGELIVLRVEITSGLWPVTIDQHQFENALVNLALNARDAMPQGGTLTIETANVTLDEIYAVQHEEVKAGDYVEVAVSDTGTGIPPEVLEKVFEPFFTTKEVGKGSGLGLSMVFGFAKQSHGYISIN
ncbi:MAG: PAS domain-containing protein, partial [bacterium]|nr:PAS domain-containing protein [bacterium]